MAPVGGRATGRVDGRVGSFGIGGNPHFSYGRLRASKTGSGPRRWTRRARRDHTASADGTEEVAHVGDEEIGRRPRRAVAAARELRPVSDVVAPLGEAPGAGPLA